MSPLTFTLRRRPSTWLDLSALAPDRLAGLSAEYCREIRLQYGRHSIPAAEFFEVTGDNAEHVYLRRCTERLVRIGAGMSRGLMEVRGRAGVYLGDAMSGGHIIVQGDAGDYVGSRMTGGKIYLSGNAGNFLGGPGPGEAHGMNEGFIAIRGNAGDRAGDKMRRGTIVIFGNAGDFAGSRMIAGTLIILGSAGTSLGFRMQRGTIIVGKKPAHMLSTFNSCGPMKMEFLRMMFKQMTVVDKRFRFFKDYGPEVLKFAGDAVRTGRGELLVLLNAGENPLK